MLRDNNGCVLGDIPCSFFGPLFYDEAAKTPR